MLTDPKCHHQFSIKASRICKIDNLTNWFFVRHARLYDPGGITDELIKYMTMAYEIAEQGAC